MLLTKIAINQFLLIQTANLYNTVFRLDKASLLQKRTQRAANTTLILKFVNLLAYCLPQ